MNPAKQTAHQAFPRGALIGAAALLGLTLLAVSTARLVGFKSASEPTTDAIESLQLQFADRDDGAVVVHDVVQRRVLTVIAPGDGGFIRGVLRGLVRERKLHGIDAKPPFRLVRWADGRLSLEDTATGRRIDLAAFGKTNASAFARFLSTPDAA